MSTSTFTLSYQTPCGSAYCGDALDVLPDIVPDESIDLIMTSPPFALQRPKEYGNEGQENYVAWFLRFADEFWRILKPTGSLVVDMGGAWEPGAPVKSLYAFELLIALCRRPRRQFFLAQDFYWFNPAKLPSPAAWVTVRRIRAKDSVNCVWWLSKTPDPKADNSRVVTEYTASMKRLLKSQKYNRGARPSGHVIREGFTDDNGGAIPPNMLAISNTGNDQRYTTGCRESGYRVHPARFPAELPRFFIEMLTDPGDTVLDPFAGSNVTGHAAEVLGRRWTSVEMDSEYVLGSAVRFENLQQEIVARPVNHLKDDFLWDGLEEDFQQKLKDKAVDYIDYARRYRPTKTGQPGVGPAVVSSTNEEVAEELSEDEMAEQLEVVEIMPVPDEPDPAIVEAKAAKLRAQKIDPRIVEVGDRTIRIYHPQGMPDSDPYFFRQSAQDGVIDIFVNDNHPFVATKVTDETDYLMFVRMCVMDAIVEHSLLRREEAGFTATFPARLKDALLRGIKV